MINIISGKYRYFLKVTAAVVALAFAWQSIAWADPDIFRRTTLQVRTVFTREDGFLALATGYLFKYLSVLENDMKGDNVFSVKEDMGSVKHDMERVKDEVKKALESCRGDKDIPEAYKKFLPTISGSTGAGDVVVNCGAYKVRYYNPFLENAENPDGAYVVVPGGTRELGKYLKRQILIQKALASVADDVVKEEENSPGEPERQKEVSGGARKTEYFDPVMGPAKALYDMETGKKLSFGRIRRAFTKDFKKISKRSGLKIDLAHLGILQEGSIRYYLFSYKGKEYAIRIFSEVEKEYLYKAEVLENGSFDEKISYEIIPRKDFRNIAEERNIPLRALGAAALIGTIPASVIVLARSFITGAPVSFLDNISYFLQVNFLSMYILILVMCCAIAGYSYWRAKEVRKYEGATPRPEARFAELPKVTIQLPIFNEANVAKRIIESACMVDYPKDKLEIQVLDDSTDETVGIIDAIIREIEEANKLKAGSERINIKAVRRPTRIGYKGGHLAYATSRAEGEFIAIFDADFIIPRDFLTRTIHYFTNEKVGLVQGVWDYVNRASSLMTRLQTLDLAGHMLIEQTVKDRKGFLWNFHGTAGIWRKATIEDAGGWRFNTVVEDSELSLKAQLRREGKERKWEFRYLDDLRVPSELPKNMLAFKSQRNRWDKGLVQVLRETLIPLWKSDLSFRSKVDATMRLAGSLWTIPGSAVLLFMWPAVMVATNLGVIYPYTFFCFGCFLLINYLTGYYLKTAYERYYELKPGKAPLLNVFAYQFGMLALYVGMIPAKVFAALQGMFDRSAVFIRTPKTGQENRMVKIYGNVKIFWLPALELVFGVYLFTAFYWGMSLMNVYWIGILAATLAPNIMGAFYVPAVTVYEMLRNGKNKKVAPSGKAPVFDPSRRRFIFRTAPVAVAGLLAGGPVYRAAKKLYILNRGDGSVPLAGQGSEAEITIPTSANWRISEPILNTGSGISAIDRGNEILKVRTDLLGTDKKRRNGEVHISVSDIPGVNAPLLNMKGKMIYLEFEVPEGFVKTRLREFNALRLYVKDANGRIQYSVPQEVYHYGRWIRAAFIPSPERKDPRISMRGSTIDPETISDIGFRINTGKGDKINFQEIINVRNIRIQPVKKPKTLPLQGLEQEGDVVAGEDGLYQNGKKVFFAGANYRGPNWRHYGQLFGCNDKYFGGRGIGASRWQTRMGIERDMWRMASSGIQVIRVDLIGDGKNMFDKEGNVKFYNDTYREDIEAFLDLAKKYGLRVEFTLADFHVARKPEGLIVQARGRPQLFSDPEKRKGFMENFLKPFLDDFGDRKEIMSIDLLNEFAWLVSYKEGGFHGMWMKSESQKEIDETFPEKPIPFEDIREFARMARDIIKGKEPRILTTIGGNDRLDGLLEKMGEFVDYYSIHYYAPLEGLAEDLEKIPRDKPVVMEEFPTAYIDKEVDYAVSDAWKYMDMARKLGLSGACVWNMTRDLDVRTWSESRKDTQLTKLRKWVDANLRMSGEFKDMQDPVALIKRVIPLIFGAGLLGANGSFETPLPEGVYIDRHQAVADRLVHAVSGIADSADEDGEVVIAVDLGLGMEKGRVNREIKDFIRKFSSKGKENELSQFFRNVMVCEEDNAEKLAARLGNITGAAKPGDDKKRKRVKPENVIVITRDDARSLFDGIEGFAGKATIAGVDMKDEDGKTIEKFPEGYYFDIMGIMMFVASKHMARMAAKRGWNDWGRDLLARLYDLIRGRALTDFNGDYLAQLLDIDAASFVIRVIPDADAFVGKALQEELEARDAALTKA